ncbi:MAG: DUF4834 family protein [Alloprevotella sp.]|nr:DUF4834 family protein [Alloprevotella sp.]MBR1652240.1 DUF4834 family protein [Alloprevotella sp.]MBR1732884.1 DUF4834 family protein [Alloprevotella sp.]
MYILSFLLLLLLAAFFLVILMPTVLLNALSRWFFSRFGGSESTPSRDEAPRPREAKRQGGGEHAARGEDGKIFRADEGEYVDFEEIG